MPNTPVLPARIRELIAADQLREALDELLNVPQLPVNDLVLLKGQLADLERDTLLRTETAENLDTRRNQLRESLLYCADQIEKSAAPKVKRGKSLKKYAFRLLLTGKVVLILFIAFHFHISAFSQGETLTLLGLLSPVLIGYLITAMKGRRSPLLSEEAQHNLPLLQGMVYIGLPLYFITIIWIMRKVPLDEWTFETARNWIAGIEIAFGGLVAYLVRTLFPE